MGLIDERVVLVSRTYPVPRETCARALALALRRENTDFDVAAGTTKPGVKWYLTANAWVMVTATCAPATAASSEVKLSSKVAISPLMPEASLGHEKMLRQRFEDVLDAVGRCLAWSSGSWRPAGARGTSKGQEPPMARCPVCQTASPLDRALCAHCGAELLPGLAPRERLALVGGGAFAILGGAVAGLVFMGPLAHNTSKTTSGLEILPFCVGLLMLVGGPILGVLMIRRSLSATPIHERHARRAAASERTDDRLAEADLNLAIDLAPRRADYFYRRGLVRERLGKLDEAYADLARARDLLKGPHDSEPMGGLGSRDLAETDVTTAMELYSKA